MKKVLILVMCIFMIGCSDKTLEKKLRFEGISYSKILRYDIKNIETENANIKDLNFKLPTNFAQNENLNYLKRYSYRNDNYYNCEIIIQTDYNDGSTSIQQELEKTVTNKNAIETININKVEWGHSYHKNASNMDTHYFVGIKDSTIYTIYYMTNKTSDYNDTIGNNCDAYLNVFVSSLNF